MYSAGNLPDHVTRYNHRYESRWLMPPERRDFSWADVGSFALLAISVAGVIITGLLMLQEVGL